MLGCASTSIGSLDTLMIVCSATSELKVSGMRCISAGYRGSFCDVDLVQVVMGGHKLAGVSHICSNWYWYLVTLSEQIIHALLYDRIAEGSHR